MAARAKSDIVSEARKIASVFGVSVQSGEAIGKSLPRDAAGAISGDVALTYEQAMLRLQLMQLEVLLDIRQGEAQA